jgi:hypothetical protein
MRIRLAAAWRLLDPGSCRTAGVLLAVGEGPQDHRWQYLVRGVASAES